jgi:hypothetical protein
MPSLDDIPHHLHTSGLKDEFFAWLISRPVPFATVKVLATLWSRNNETKLSRTDWEFLEQHAFQRAR